MLEFLAKLGMAGIGVIVAIIVFLFLLGLAKVIINAIFSVVVYVIGSIGGRIIGKSKLVDDTVQAPYLSTEDQEIFNNLQIH